ncbi:MAG TPA: hypothetical protein VK132_07460, partial [Gemmatimonadales bacterium]|nr:hypothetical protein [Gemmatimonadales bacterium]
MAAPPAIEEPRAEPRRRGIPGSLLPWIFVLGFAITAGIAARFLILDRLLYEIWADRDLSRAEELLRRPRFTGAEFDRG